MIVAELIAHLQTLDKKKQIQVWDPYRDDATAMVYVTELNNGKVMIANTNFGTAPRNTRLCDFES